MSNIPAKFWKTLFMRDKDKVYYGIADPASVILSFISPFVNIITHNTNINEFARVLDSAPDLTSSKKIAVKGDFLELKEKLLWKAILGSLKNFCLILNYELNILKLKFKLIFSFYFIYNSIVLNLFETCDLKNALHQVIYFINFVFKVLMRL